MDVCQPETPADDKDVREPFLDLAGPGVGNDIEILGGPS
jgi:hypothetical protein